MYVASPAQSYDTSQLSPSFGNSTHTRSTPQYVSASQLAFPIPHGSPSGIGGARTRHAPGQHMSVQFGLNPQTASSAHSSAVEHGPFLPIRPWNTPRHAACPASSSSVHSWRPPYSHVRAAAKLRHVAAATESYSMRPISTASVMYAGVNRSYEPTPAIAPIDMRTSKCVTDAQRPAPPNP